MIAEWVQFFGLGLAATASPCVLPLYPGFLAYLAASGERWQGQRGMGLLGLCVLGGVLTMMLALGLLIGALRAAVGSVVVVVTPLAGLLIIGLGILLLLDQNPFARLPQARSPTLRNPFAGAFVYGLLYGPIAFPCSGPFIAAAFLLSAGTVLIDFLFFGLGFGLPLLVLSLLAGAQQRRVTHLLARHSHTVNLAAGVILIALGAITILENWDNLLLYLGWV